MMLILLLFITGSMASRNVQMEFNCTELNFNSSKTVSKEIVCEPLCPLNYSSCGSAYDYKCLSFEYLCEKCNEQTDSLKCRKDSICLQHELKFKCADEDFCASSNELCQTCPNGFISDEKNNYKCHNLTDVCQRCTEECTTVTSEDPTCKNENEQEIKCGTDLSYCVNFKKLYTVISCSNVENSAQFDVTKWCDNITANQIACEKYDANTCLDTKKGVHCNQEDCCVDMTEVQCACAADEVSCGYEFAFKCIKRSQLREYCKEQTTTTKSNERTYTAAIAVPAVFIGLLALTSIAFAAFMAPPLLTSPIRRKTR